MPSTVTVRRAASGLAQRQPPRWASLSARDLGLRPSTVESRVHGTSRRTAQDEMATIIRRLLESGNRELAVKVFTPIETAMAGAEVPPFGAEVVGPAVRADEEEAIARDIYLVDPTPGHFRAWRVALEAQMATARVLYLAMVAREREGHC